MAAIFFSIFNTSPISYNFCLLCLKMVSFILSDGEFYRVSRYIWFIYVFCYEVGIFSFFFLNMLGMHEKCRQRSHLFNFLLTFFLQNEMYCNLCLVRGNVSGFFHLMGNFI